MEGDGWRCLQKCSGSSTPPGPGGNRSGPHARGGGSSAARAASWLSLGRGPRVGLVWPVMPVRHRSAVALQGGAGAAKRNIQSRGKQQQSEPIVQACAGV